MKAPTLTTDDPCLSDNKLKDETTSVLLPLYSLTLSKKPPNYTIQNPAQPNLQKNSALNRRQSSKNGPPTLRR
jgi:hypothetical protein